MLWNYHFFEGVGHGFFKQAVIILFVRLGIIGVRIYKPVEKKVNYIFLGIWSILGILQFVSALTVSKEYFFLR